MRIVAVIPTWNEAGRIGAQVHAVTRAASPVGVVVSDCASHDDTRREARGAGALVHDTPPPAHRAAAVNAGVEAALTRFPHVQALWIVHADVLVPPQAGEHIRETLAHERNVGGAFHFAFDARGLSPQVRLKLALVTRINRLRYRCTGTFFGDQGVFFQASAWSRVGPLPDWPLMEDAELARRLQRLGQLVLVPATMPVSPRRFLRHGPLRQLALDAVLIVLHGLGVKPPRVARLAKWYNREKA